MNGLSIDMRRNKIRSLVTVSLLTVALLGLGGCDKLKARDQLNRGIQSFKAGQTDAAIENFKQAKELDPNLLMAKLYLGTAYQSSYIPGATSDENQRMGTQALGGISGRAESRSEQSGCNRSHWSAAEFDGQRAVFGREAE